MKMWEKYGQVLNDPVRNLNVRFAFQDGNITEIEASPRYHDFNVILAYFYDLPTADSMQI